MFGKLLWFNSLKGYGEIESEDGERFFFTKEELSKKCNTEKLENSTELSFSKSSQLFFGSFRAIDIELLNYQVKKSRRVQIKEAKV